MVSFLTPIPIIILHTHQTLYLPPFSGWLHCSMVSTLCLVGDLFPAPVSRYPIVFIFGLPETGLYKLALNLCLSVVVTRLQILFTWDFDSSLF